MVNLGDAPVDYALEFTSEESPSSAWDENPEYMQIIYDRIFPIFSPDTPQGDYTSGLYSSGYVSNLQMSDIIVCVASLAH